MKLTFYTAVLTMVFAASIFGGILSLERGIVSPRGEFVVEVKISSAEEILAAQYEISYDKSRLQFLRMEKEPLAESTLTAVNDVNGKLRVAFASGTPLPSMEGVLCKLFFKVIEPGIKRADLKVDRIVVNDKPQEAFSVSLDMAKETMR